MFFHEMGGRSVCVKYGMAWDLGEEREQGRMQLSNAVCEMRYLICFDCCKRGVRNQNVLCQSQGGYRGSCQHLVTGKQATPCQLGHECVRGMA